MKMTLPLPEWKDDHILIPSGLHELLYQGFSILMTIKLEKPQGKTVIETIIRKEKPEEKVKPAEISPMALYLQQFMPDAFELLNKDFALKVCVSLGKIEVIAEKRL